MPIGQRPQRRNPQAPRLTFWPELESCPVCHQPLVSKGSAVHSHKTIQTLGGEFHVVAYSRRCTNPDCSVCGKHFHSGEHLKLSLPYSTYGLDVIARIGQQRQREHKQFVEIQQQLNEQGVEINDTSVGRLYRLFLALMSGNWPHRSEKMKAAAQEYGGLILMCDGLQPDGEGPYLYVLWEVLSGVPISGEFLEPADTLHLSQWLERCGQQLGETPILALLSDGEPALVAALAEVWPDVVHQLCQMHFLGNLSEPLQKEDLVLKQQLQQDLKGLPRVPDLAEQEVAQRLECWPVLPGESLKKKTL